MSLDQVARRNPLFLVGMPRSGTKLLRDLLNQNPQVALLPEETHFLPYFIQKFGNPPDFGSQGLIKLVDELETTAFSLNMSKKIGTRLDASNLLKLSAPFSWEAIFHSIWNSYISPEDIGATVWGDKTPGYLRHMKLLRDIFPGAMFLHIFRDPRDYALSVKRSFGKSLLRAADRWRDGILDARQVGAQLGTDYLEVSYEDLVQRPRATLERVASFLEIPFVDSMLALNAPSENLGDAIGMTGILQSNTGKYAKYLRENAVRRVEEITYDVAIALGYELKYAQSRQSLNSLQKSILKLADGFASMRMHIRTRGLAAGFRYFILHYRKSSWRQWD